MKTAIFYVLLFVGSIWAFNAEAYALDYVFNDEAERWVEENRDDIAPKLVERCEGIIGVGYEAIAMRDEGLDLEVTLDDLHKSLKITEEELGGKIKIHLKLEMERMIRTVYRNPEMEVPDYNRRFFAECIMMEGY